MSKDANGGWKELIAFLIAVGSNLVGDSKKPEDQFL